MAEDATKEAVPEVQNDLSFWQEQHDAVSTGDRLFLFTKAEKTRVKLLAHGTNPREWFKEVDTEYRGTKSKKYLIPCYEISDPNNQTEWVFQVLVATKGTWAGITGLLAEGYQFFDKKSAAVIITRSVGQRVSYQVMPSPPAVQIEAPEEMWAEAQNFDWDEVLAEHKKMQEGRATGSADGSPANALADAIINDASAPQTGAGW